MSGNIDTEGMKLFTGQDCSVWLKQLTWVYYGAFVDRNYIQNGPGNTPLDPKQHLEDSVLLCLTLAVSVTCLLLLLGLACAQKEQLGYCHLLSAAWTLMQIPSVVAVRNLPAMYYFKAEDFKYLSYSNLFNQLMTLGTIAVVWLAVGRLKRVEV